MGREMGGGWGRGRKEEPGGGRGVRRETGEKQSSRSAGKKGRRQENDLPRVR